MLKKLAKTIEHSPSQYQNLGVMLRRSRKDYKLRKIGLLLLIVTVCVQLMFIFNPIKQRIQPNENDLIPGGVTSVDDLLKAYISGTQGSNPFPKVIEGLGIGLDSLSNLKDNSPNVCSDSNSTFAYSTDRSYSYLAGSKTHIVNLPDRTQSTYFSAPIDQLSLHTTCYEVLSGHTSAGDWFAIVKSNGTILKEDNSRKSIVGEVHETSCKNVYGRFYKDADYIGDYQLYFFENEPTKDNLLGAVEVSPSSSSNKTVVDFEFELSKPITNRSSLHVYLVDKLTSDEDAIPLANIANLPHDCPAGGTKDIKRDNLDYGVVKFIAFNNIGNVDHSRFTASEGDRLEVAVYTTNLSSRDIIRDIRLNTTDINEYGNILDTGGAQVNNAEIVWRSQRIKKHQTNIKHFVLQLNTPVTDIRSPSNQPMSYDCTLSIIYGNQANWQISCPDSKIAQLISTSLPSLGRSTTLIMLSLVVVILSILTLRAFYIKHELQNIRGSRS